MFCRISFSYESYERFTMFSTITLQNRNFVLKQSKDFKEIIIYLQSCLHLENILYPQPDQPFLPLL